MQLSYPKQQAFDKIRGYWYRANSHISTIQSRMEMQIAFGFYDGSGQWRAEDLAALKERKQLEMIINFIQGKVDSLSGVEIQSRYRSACRNDSGSPDLDELAKALTHYLYYIQQDQEIPYQGSLKFRDMLICGIGWSNAYKENGKFFYEYVNPYNILPDPDDLSPQYTDMKYVCRKRWMDPKMVKRIWPRVAQYVGSPNDDTSQSMFSPELMDRNMTYTAPGVQTAYNQGRLLVCEVQYKEPKKAYSGIDYQGYYFETFDEEKAEEIANKKSEIEEIDANRTMRGLFFDNYLLEHGPLDPDVPNVGDFGYIPCVWKRRFRTGVPYGLVDCMKSIQTDLNVRVTKSLYLANSSRVIIEGPLPSGQTKDTISQTLKTSDAVIVLPTGTKADIRDNAVLSPIHLEFADKYIALSQVVTGITADLMGERTNAESGVAQKQRQMSSIRTSMFAFDNFSAMKKREAKFFLKHIQGSGEENILTQIMDTKEQQSIILNLTREIKGKKVVLNDVRTLPISLYIEEVPDYASTFEENKAALENLLGNPRADIIMNSKEIMDELGIRNAEKIAADFQQITAGQQAARAGQPAPQQQIGQPSANDPSSLGQQQGLI